MVTMCPISAPSSSGRSARRRCLGGQVVVKDLHVVDLGDVGYTICVENDPSRGRVGRRYSPENRSFALVGSAVDTRRGDADVVRKPLVGGTDHVDQLLLRVRAS